MKRLHLLVALVLSAVAAVALVPLLVPAPAHAQCTLPELPGVGCVAPSPTPTESPSPSPSPPAQPEPTDAASPAPTAPPDEEPAPLPTSPEVLQPGAPPPVVPPAPEAPPPVVPSATPVAAVAATTPLTQVVPSAYAIVVFGLLGIALLAGFLSGLTPVGGSMKATRTRLWAGLAVLGVAAVVGGIGWYRISGEPLLNRQIPFLASAGIAVVLLAVLGGALIVAEQLRSDQDRIGELEDAVRALTEALAPTIESPPRRASTTKS